MAIQDIKSLLTLALQHGASDLHLHELEPPRIRKDGQILVLQPQILSSSDMQTICFSLLNNEQKERFEESLELDFAMQIKSIGRFRVNLFKTLGKKLAASLRIIPQNIPTLEELQVPSTFFELTRYQKGLVLVTGPTGSGKSTTLAALIDHINSNFCKHILTIEDPIEFIHSPKKSLISQRGVHEETLSYLDGLKSALRQDPDVILIGEMRDPQTIATALSAAETGHLVFGTLHTNSSSQTIHRIVESFPADKQVQIRSMLSSSLKAVISQRLVEKIGGGRVGAYEILINNSAISNLIRENKIHQIYGNMQLGYKQTGMMTLEMHLNDLLRHNIISQEVADEHNELIQGKRT